MRSKRTPVFIAVLLIAGLLAAPLLPVYSGPKVVSTMAPITRSPQQEIYIGDVTGASDSGNGLQIILGEGSEMVQPSTVMTPAPAAPLDDAATQLVIDRLPPLTTEASDVVDFRLPEESLPPPQTGATITTTFPTTDSAGTPPTVVSGPLEVLRYSPEGEIPLAPFLSVTFNQPMVPLATIDALTAADVPVKLTPDLPGIWRWVGTQTLTFEYVGGENERFPMATVFTVEVPTGTQSATGGTLADAVIWNFATPAPILTFSTPNYGPQRRDALLFAGFDQLINAADVLATINVTAGGRSYPVRQATAEEVAADPNVKSLAAHVGEGRWVAFAAEEQFPADTTVTVNIGPGTPSAEGPRTTETVQSFSFTTYAPLRIDSSYCSWGGDECPPLSPFTINFNNPLDLDAFDEAWVQIEPEIPGVSIRNHGYAIEIAGATQGRTTYNVTLSADLLDEFGQTLGSDQTVTFRTGSARQALYGTRNTLVTVDPSVQSPGFTIYSINYARLRVRAYAVTPEDWEAYLTFYNDRWSDTPPSPPGREVLSSIFQIEAVPDTVVETTIDLSGALSGPTGHLIVVVDYPANPFFGRNDGLRNAVIAWVQVTQIGVDAFSDNTEMVAWTTALQNGAPLPDVTVTLQDTNVQGTTDANGVARLQLPASLASLLVAQRGDDIAILPRSLYPWYGDGWTRSEISDEVRWYIFDDRAMYRPGEDVHVKGWLRRIGAGPTGDVTLLDGATSVRYQVYDPQGATLVDEITDLNDLGGFDFAFNIPTAANLGYANIYLSVVGVTDVYGTDAYHNFQIQEFRRPEFQVTARTEGEGPYFVDKSAETAVTAAYFAGGPLPNADTTWNVTASPSSYSPPNWPDFVFGKWVPWWFYYEPDVPASTFASYSGKTDASGTHYLRMDFSDAGTPRPWSVNAEAVVMDVNRQAWASSTNLLVHPASLYVGLRSARTFVKQGEPLEIEAIVTDLDGNAVEDRPIEMRAARLQWEFKDNQWQQEEADVQECSVGSLIEPVTCTFTTTLGGEYRIVATIQDGEGRANVTEFTRWVSGGNRPAARNVAREEVTLIPDKQSYQPGDVAEILIQSPFVPASGLITLNRDGIISTEAFSMTESTYTWQVPIVDAHIPNLYVNVELVGAAERTDAAGNPIPDTPARPAYAGGQLNLVVPPLSRTLAISATLAATELSPGGETTLDLVVVDATGAPVENTELAVVIVDEAILALTNYQLADPIASFYQQRGNQYMTAYGRGSLVLASAAELAQGLADSVQEEAAAGRGGGPEATMAPDMAMPAPAMSAEAPAMESATNGMSGPQAATPITVRTDFNPLAVFDPAVRTDAEGRATVAVKVPDNLTRYRVMVVGVAEGKYFGAAETNLTARLPLMVRPAAPRFLNFGDQFDLPVMLQNQTNAPLTVDVVVEAANLALTEHARAARRDPGQRPASWCSSPRPRGTPVKPRLQIAAVSGDYADAATIDLPVYTPATTEAFATYGVVDEGAIAQPLAAPTNVFPQFGGLEVATSSTALQELTDAVLYLSAYPFECSEQIASRVLGVAALRDVLTAFQAAGLPSPEELEKAMDRDIARLASFQNDDGGFPDLDPRPTNRCPITASMSPMRWCGHKKRATRFPTRHWQRALDHLRQIEIYYPYWYSPITRHALSAYALYVRDLLGDVDTGKARDLLAEYPLELQSLEAISWIWQVLSDDAASVQELAEIRRYVDNRAVETACAWPTSSTSYGDDAYRHAPFQPAHRCHRARCADQRRPEQRPDPQGRQRAARRTARQAVGATPRRMSLCSWRWIATSTPLKSVTPDFVARVWLGDTYVAEHEFRGRTTDTKATEVPMGYLVDPELGGGEERDIIIAKEGDGRLYYRLGLSYAPTDLKLDPLDMGFIVQRIYEAVDDPADVTLDEEGVWHIKAGARVRVKLTMVANNRRYHVALVDPLPAGLEIINPALAVSESVPTDPSERQDVWLVVVVALVRTPESARRTRRSLHLTAVGRGLHLFVCGARHHAGHFRRAARQGRGDVHARGLWPQRQRQGDRGIRVQFSG